MRCPLEGEIQEYIDGETDNNRSMEIEEHLLECHKCKAVYNQLTELNDFVEGKLNIYNESVSEDTNVCIKPFMKDSEQLKINFRRVGYYNMLKNKRIFSTVCAVLVIALCISVQPVRAAISNALSIFRVENVKSLAISVEDLTKIQREISSHKSFIDLDKLGNINTSGGEKQALTLSEINKVTDFKVLMPTLNLPSDSSIYTITPTTVKFNLNIANVNNLLASFGAEKPLPNTLSGKAFSIDIPRTVNIQYYINEKHISIIETKTPQLQVPADVNVDEIYSSLIALPILPDSLQRQLKSIKDWKTTMYVPVVESQMDEVDINGVKGYASATGILRDNGSIVKDNVKDKDSSYVIWFKDGVFYEINGNVDRNELINIAKSMR
jgi:hypothetical protein